RGNGEGQLEPGDRLRELPGLGGEGKPRRVDAQHGEPELRVALRPGAQIGKGANAREVRRVDEVDEHRPPGADPLDRRGLGADPDRAGHEGRHRYALCFGTQSAGILPAGPRFEIRSRGDPLTQRTWDRIESARERWNVLRHPVYRRWSAGELSGEELARYSGQYRHAVQAIAEVSNVIAEAAPERPELRRHAAEEREHVALWDGFGAAAGGS